MTGQDIYSPTTERKPYSGNRFAPSENRKGKAHTRPEVRVAEILSANKVFYRTQPDTHTGKMDDDGNEIVLHPDFLIGEKVVLEVDGEYHRSAKMQRRDDERDKILARLGFAVVRVPNSEVEKVMDYLLVAQRSTP